MARKKSSSSQVVRLVLALLFSVIGLALVYAAATRPTDLRSKAAATEKILKGWEFNGRTTEGWIGTGFSNVGVKGGSLFATLAGKPETLALSNDQVGLHVKQGFKFIKLRLMVQLPQPEIRVTAAVTKSTSLGKESARPPINSGKPVRNAYPFKAYVYLYELQSEQNTGKASPIKHKKISENPLILEGIADSQYHEYSLKIADTLRNFKIDKIEISFIGIQPAKGTGIFADWIRITTQADTKLTPTPSGNCYYQQVQCDTWPCPTILVCPTATPKPSPTPTPIVGPRTLRDTRERLFVIGGAIGSNADHVDSISSKVEYYDPLTKTWHVAAPMKYSRSWHTAATLGNKIYVFGHAYIDRALTVKAEVYNVLTNTWQEIKPPPDLYANELGYNAFPWGNKIFLIMPLSENNILKTAVYAYDIALNSYTKLASSEQKIAYCAEYLTKIYCLSRGIFTQVFVYTPKTNSWTKFPIVNSLSLQDGIIGHEYGIYAILVNPQGIYYNLFSLDYTGMKLNPVSIPLAEINNKNLFGLTMGSFGSGIVVAGGLIPAGGTSVAQKEVYIYDPAYGSTKLPEMLNGRVNFATAVLPLAANAKGASVRGKMTENGQPLTTKARLVLYKITEKLEGGRQFTSLVATQNLDASGQFAFYGLDAGEYSLDIKGDHSSYRVNNFNMDNIILTNNQVLSNLEIIAYK